MTAFNIPPRKAGVHIQMPKADLEMVLAMLRNPANADKQGKFSLFNHDPATAARRGYCCLGAMQCAKTGGKVELDRSMPSCAWLDAQGWAFWSQVGMRTNNPYLPALCANAATANDNQNRTFAEIADAIEACAEGY